MKRLKREWIALSGLLSLIVGLALGACGKNAPPEPASHAEHADEAAKTQQYACPMHPRVISDKPAQCPICGMDLVPVGSEDASAKPADRMASSADSQSKQGASSKGEILYYRNPMGLPDTSPVPKKDSMGMDYIPVYENENAVGGVAVVVAPETIQTLGVKIEVARQVNFGRTIRTFGAVAENVRLQTEIASRIDGWIDELAITVVGDEVRKGDLLFRMRSPDLIAAERDYVTALKSESARWAASSATRLKSLGLQDQTIAAIRARGSVEALTPFYAERHGVISMLNVRKGAFIKSGDQIATIADYSQVWVVASVAEQDLPLIKAGAPAMVTFPNTPAAGRTASVDYVYPTVDPKTRTGKARIVLDNQDLALRPGAYADVSFEIDAKSRLAVPSEAILRDQDGAHVIMAMGDGRFMPMAVKTGAVALGLTEIVDGLKPGDAIVVSGQFLIDSESSLRESLGKMTAPGAVRQNNASLKRVEDMQ